MAYCEWHTDTCVLMACCEWPAGWSAVEWVGSVARHTLAGADGLPSFGFSCEYALVSSKRPRPKPARRLRLRSFRAFEQEGVPWPEELTPAPTPTSNPNPSPNPNLNP